MTWVVRAEVIDIGVDRPDVRDCMWVDSNVWIKIAYTRTSFVEARPYANYVGAVKRIGAALVTGPVAFAEVGKHVEMTELNAWMARNNDTRSPHMMIKTFRADPVERPNVVGELKTTWAQMTGLAQMPTSSIEHACISRACTGLDAGEFLDAPDSIQLAEAKRIGVKQVLTADKDFASVPGIVVFTANRVAIDGARAAGLLRQR